MKDAAQNEHLLEEIVVEWVEGIHDGIEGDTARRCEYDEQAQIGHEVFVDHEFHADEHGSEHGADRQKCWHRAVKEEHQEKAEQRFGAKDFIESKQKSVP